MPSNENQTVPGDVLEFENGNRFVVLPNGFLAYLGNRQLHRSVGLVERTGRPCRVLGRMALLPYVSEDAAEMDEIEQDWDLLRGRERIPAPLPQGCTCGHDALTAVVNCDVHEVKMRGKLVPVFNPERQLDGNAVQFQRSVRMHIPLAGVIVFEKDQVIWRQHDGMWGNPDARLPGILESQVAQLLHVEWVKVVNRSDFDTYPSIV